MIQIKQSYNIIFTSGMSDINVSLFLLWIRLSRLARYTPTSYCMF